jgi:hypothetical protein
MTVTYDRNDGPKKGPFFENTGIIMPMDNLEALIFGHPIPPAKEQTDSFPEPVDVTFFKPRGVFKKAIGTHIGADGKPSTTIFWLGRDHRRAVENARLILRAQARFRAEGAMQKHWTPETLIRAKQAIKNADMVYSSRVERARKTVAEADKLDTAYPVATETPPTPPAPTKGKTLHEATKAYIESVQRKQLSEAHKDGARHMMERLRKDRRDIPMADIDYAWLDTCQSGSTGRMLDQLTRSKSYLSVLHM